VKIDDVLPGLSQITFDKPFTSLKPGEFITATATYAITEQNICDCFVENFATAYANPLGGKPNDTSDDAIAKDGLIIRFDNCDWWTESVDVAPTPIDLGGNPGGNPTTNPTTNPVTPLPGLPTTSGNTIYGTGGNDVINPGGNVDYLVYANEGQNAIVTGNGQDALYGGSGLDAFVAGDGDNTIYANEGRNIVITGNGKNTVYGGSIADAIFTGSGDDLIYANEGDNYVSAGAGNNQVYVGGGVDYVVLTAGAGSSKVYNFNAAQDTFGLAGINASDITVEQIGSGGYFTRISAGTDVLAELDGVHVTKSQLKLETLGNAGNSSVSFLVDPLRSDLRNQLVAAGMPAATVNSLFA
jgi:Ca2+-binding RTX toxin-like protein